MLSGHRSIAVPLLALSSWLSTAQPLSIEDIPKTQGYPLMIQHCYRCHDFSLIGQQSLSRKGWDDLITWMQKKHNLEFLDTSTRDEILTYLSTHFGEKKQLDRMDQLSPRRANPLPKTSP